MRENRTHGSEGGEDGVFPYPYQRQGTGAACRSHAPLWEPCPLWELRPLWEPCPLIGVEKDTVLPSLRTVRAVFPHTALQLVVSSSGLARSLVGCSHSEQSHVCEVCIWPSSVIVMAVSHSRSLFLLAQD